MEDWFLLYTAGFFDGEGYVALRRKRYGRRESRNVAGHMDYAIETVMSNINEEVILKLQERWGGTVSHISPKRENERDLYRLTIYSAKAMTLLRAIQPYSIVKRHQIELALKYDEHVQETRLLRYQKGVKGIQPYPPEIAQIRLAFFNEMKVINHRWIRTHGLTDE